jgi:transcription elongation factor GreB
VNKAFVKESDQDEDEELAASVPGLPPGSHNYMTRKGYEKLKAELDQLVREERPVLVETIRWAASNGDRSENGDYIYGKKRLREIDRRIRFLLKRLESSTVVAPAEQENTEQVFFGATVTVCDVDGADEQTYQIVGVDEANASEGRISWIAPLSRALLKAREGDVVRFASPAGMREIEVVEIRYE